MLFFDVLLQFIQNTFIDYGYLWVFLASLLEGEFLLFAVSSIAYMHEYPIIGLGIAATLGGSLYDALIYWLGKRYHKHVYHIPVIRHFIPRKGFDAFQKFYEKNGWLTLIFCRFVYGTRTLGPLMAGMTHMPYLKFTFYNVGSAFIWSTFLFWLIYTFIDNTKELNNIIHTVGISALLLIILIIISIIIKKKFFPKLKENHTKKPQSLNTNP